MGLLLPPLPREEPAADDEGSERVHARAGFLLLLQRLGLRPQPAAVGPGQPDVVERLPALELDLAEFAQGNPARSGPPARGDASESARRQRMQALRPRQGSTPHRSCRGSPRLIFAVLLAVAASLAAAQPLVDAARKEGSLTLYTSNAAPTIQALSGDFEKRYGVRVNVWRASSAKVLLRLVAEKKAGRWDFDAVSIAAPELEALYREDLLQEISSPAHEEMLAGTMPAHRGWG